MSQACTRAFGEMLACWSASGERSPERRLASIVSSYLSTEHRDKPGEGCVTATLAAEAARHGGELRRPFTEGIPGLRMDVDGRAATHTMVQSPIACVSALMGACIHPARKHDGNRKRRTNRPALHAADRSP
jgi:TetR/AcrR family transcriptional repressor of nem operon